MSGLLQWLLPAAVYASHGPSSVLSIQNIPRPIPSSGQALVRVSAACVNPIDIKLRKHPISSLILPTPKIPGTDISGTVVVSTGSEYSTGDEVIAMMPILFWSYGASAEYAAIPISLLAPKPKNISFLEASSLPLVGITVVTGFDSVLQKLGDKDGLKKSKILVQAGSGGVGSFAVQYAKHVLGAEIVASTCSTSKMDYVRSLGADLVIDYKTTRFEDVVQDYDVVFDTLAYEYKDRTLNPHSSVIRRDGKGHYIHVGGSSPKIGPGDPGSDPFGFSVPEARIDKLLSHYWQQWSTSVSISFGSSEVIHYHVVFVRPDGEKLSRVAHYVEEGKIKCFVEKSFPLHEIAHAHDHVEEGHALGKTVVTIP